MQFGQLILPRAGTIAMSRTKVLAASHPFVCTSGVLEHTSLWIVCASEEQPWHYPLGWVSASVPESPKQKEDCVVWVDGWDWPHNLLDSIQTSCWIRSELMSSASVSTMLLQTQDDWQSQKGVLWDTRKTPKSGRGVGVQKRSVM